MNPELQKELAAWLTKLRESADAAGSFVLEQAPLIIQEKVSFERAQLTVLSGLLLVAIATCAVIVYRHIQRVRAEHGDTFEVADTNPGIVIPFSFGGIVLCIPTAAVVSECLKVWLAPRLYVLEWLAGLVK